jgi:hypothetical protein
MPLFKWKVPLLSLLLLFTTYMMIGRLVLKTSYSEQTPWLVWIGSILVAVLYLHPLDDLNRFLRRWFSSDTVAFSVLVLIAAAASILFNWFNLFLPMLLILAVEALARLDLQVSEYTESQTFVMLVMTTTLGLLAGSWF